MNWQYTPLIFPLLIAAAITAGLAIYSWRRRLVLGAAPFAVLMLAAAEWSLVYAFRLVSADLPTMLFWAKVRYIGIVIAPTAWLAFVFQYTGREKWLTLRSVALLAIEPLATLILVWTNEAHHLIWADVRLENSGTILVWRSIHGIAFWIHAAYSYFLLVVTALLLIQALIRSPRVHRVQVVVLLVGAVVPLVADVFSTLGLISLPLDLAPLSFAVVGLVVGWGIFRFRLFDIVPVARNAVVDSITGGVIVLDLQGRVLDVNPAAQKIIGRAASEIVGQPLGRLLADRPDLIEQYRSVTEAEAEITLGKGEARRDYELHISPLRDQSERLRGRLILVYDITERKRTEASLMAQKQLFESLVAMARAMAKHPSLEATLQSALNMAATLTRAEHGSMFLLDGTGVVTHSALARGGAAVARPQDIERDVVGGKLAGWVVQHRQPALVYDTSQDERWLELPNAPYAVRSALAIPIVSGSAVLGVLTLVHSQTNHFSTEDAFLIQSAADQMTLGLRNAQMYDEQRRLADRQTTLYEALRTVGQHLDPETIAHAAVESVARLTGWPAVAILLPDETATYLVVRAVAGALSIAEGHRLDVDQGVIGRAFRTAQTQHVPDVSADPDYVRSAAGGRPTLRGELAVPLRRGERLLGVLDAASDQLAAFTNDDILLAESLAEAIALAMDNARLYAEIRRYAADLSALYTFARAISRSLVLDDVLAETLHSALTALDFDAGLILLADPGDGHLYLAAERGLPPEMSARIHHEDLGGTLCAYVHSQGEAVAVGDIGQEAQVVEELERVAAPTIREMRAAGLLAYSGIPLLHQDRSLGTLSLYARQPRTISAEDRGLQVAIGRQIATAVTNAQLFQAIADERSRLQSLIESSRDGIILIGLDRHMLVINAPALEMLHLDGQPQDWVNRPLPDALNPLKPRVPDVVRVLMAEMRRVRTGDELPGEGEIEIPPRAIHWLNLPVMTGQTPLGRLWVLRDVTEEQLLERMRDDLVHAMVHDLRNPLAAISGALSFLDEDIAGMLSPSQRELWDIAQRSTKGMLELVRAILEISQLESQQIPLDQTLISLPDLVTEALDSQRPLAIGKHLHLESDVPSTLPPAWADAKLVDRVLTNLIGNACKFTPAGGVVRVSARMDPAQRSTLFVSVSDTGPGIPPEIQDRLFQRFVTGHHEGRGNGLGLAFCKMVMEAHGQRIWVENTSKSGTTFTFTLPLPPAMSGQGSGSRE